MGVVHASPVTLKSSSTVLRARQLELGTGPGLELSGEADLTTLSVLRAALEESRARHGGHIVIDVTGLRFCDVHSAQLILSVSRTTPTTVVGAQGSVLRVLELLASLAQVPRYSGVLCLPILR